MKDLSQKKETKPDQARERKPRAEVSQESTKETGSGRISKTTKAPGSAEEPNQPSHQSPSQIHSMDPSRDRSAEEISKNRDDFQKIQKSKIQQSTAQESETKDSKIETSPSLSRGGDHISQSNIGSRAGKSRSSRPKVKAETLHAVHCRDRGQCQARLPNGKICGEKKWLHVHHIVPFSHRGTDILENLVTLCSSHHRLWHERKV
jgi:hypothetical protein